MAPTTPLDPRQIGVWRHGLMLSLLPLGLALAAGLAAAPGPAWARLATLVALIAAGLTHIARSPAAWHRAARYDLAGDELLWARGVLVHVRTVVPLARVQHIDVAQGWLERRAGVARLVVHTAGTGSTDVAVPGLALADAEALRDRIRLAIRAEAR